MSALRQLPWPHLEFRFWPSGDITVLPGSGQAPRNTGKRTSLGRAIDPEQSHQQVRFREVSVRAWEAQGTFNLEQTP
jgi:hypothetical protein